MKKANLLFPALLATLALVACNPATSEKESSSKQEESSQNESKPSESTNPVSSSTGGDTPVESSGDPEPLPRLKTAHGTGALFTEFEGYSAFDAKVFEEDGVRYLTYMSNPVQQMDSNAVYVRKGTKVDGKWVYGEKHLAVSPSESGWDKKITAPTVVTGEFKNGATTYKYLMAYQGSAGNGDNTKNSIGFAVSNDMLGTWTKVGDAPILECTSDSIYGYGSPELVNYDEHGGVILGYTWGEATLTCTAIQKIDASDLTKIAVDPGYSQLPSKGLVDGAATPIFANAGFAIGTSLYTVRDVYPLSSNAPGHSTSIEVSKASPNILTSAEEKWTPIKTISGTDTMDDDDPDSLGWDEVYSPSFVTNGLGAILDTKKLEVVYTGQDEKGTTYTNDYRFSSFVCSYDVSLE